MSVPRPGMIAGWEDEAQRLEPLIDGLSAVVLLGADPAATAEVAVRLGRAQSVRRSVTIGDLVGELPALEGLITHEDPHGLSDAFTYGISLDRVRHPVPGTGNLYISPSGTEPVAAESILAHPRWPGVVSRFRERGTLLMLVVDPRSPGVSRLIEATDGAIVVGDEPLDLPERVLARTPPRGLPRLADSAEVPATSTPAASTVHPTPTPAAPEPEGRQPPRSPRRRISLTFIVAALATGSGVVALAAGRGWPDARGGTPPFGAPVSAPAPLAPAADPPPAVENPADEEDASAYTLVLRAANTPAGASDNLERLADLPAATMGPSLDGTGIWYKVFAGAYHDRAEAESLRVSLRDSGRAGGDLKPIAFLPFALLIADSVGADSAALVSSRFRALGIPAYPLVQADGWTRVYAGAFATRDEAMHLAPVVRAGGLQPRIVYRTGRPL